MNNKPADDADSSVGCTPIVSEYQLTRDGEHPRITLRRMLQADGSVKWCVKGGDYVLNKRGCWEYDLMPSERDGAFLARTRFDHEAEATAAYLRRVAYERGREGQEPR